MALVACARHDRASVVGVLQGKSPTAVALPMLCQTHGGPMFILSSRRSDQHQTCAGPLLIYAPFCGALSMRHKGTWRTRPCSSCIGADILRDKLKPNAPTTPGRSLSFGWHPGMLVPDTHHLDCCATSWSQPCSARLCHDPFRACAGIPEAGSYDWDENAPVAMKLPWTTPSPQRIAVSSRQAHASSGSQVESPSEHLTPWQLWR